MPRLAILPLLGTLAITAGPDHASTSAQQVGPKSIPTARMCVMMDLGKPTRPGYPGTNQPRYHREIGAIAEGPDGSFLTTTAAGGPSDLGMVFKITRDGAWEPWYAFQHPRITPGDGANPQGGLTKGSDGAWYGTTTLGGKYGAGMIFKVIRKDHVEELYSFRNNNPRGLKRPCERCDYSPAQKAAMMPAYPIAPPIDGGDGFLYGVTPVAGNLNTGAVYRISKPYGDDGFETICVFDSRLLRLKGLEGYYCGVPGSRPAGLILSNGGQNLYGVLKGAPAYIFSAALGSKPTIIHKFEGRWDPKPTQVMQADDGMLYGTTYEGGDAGVGTIYRLHPVTGDFEVLSSFLGKSGGLLGKQPVAGLAEGVDASGTAWLYGATRLGGKYNRGMLFRIPRSGGPLEVLHDFDLFANGWQPMTTPVVRGDTVFGFTLDGGLYRGGTFYRLTKPGFPTQVLHDTKTSLGQALFTSKPSTVTDDQVKVRTRVKASQTSLLDAPPPGLEDYMTDGVSVSLFCRNPQLVQFISRDIRRNGKFQPLRHRLSNGQEYDLSLTDDDDAREWHHDGGSAQDGYYASGPAAGRRWDGPTRGKFGLTIYDKPTFPEWFDDPKTGQRARTIYDPSNLAQPHNEIWRARARVFAMCNCEVKWEIFWTTDIRYNPANLTAGIRIWEDGVDPERIRIKPVPPGKQAETLAWINKHLRAGVDPLP